MLLVHIRAGCEPESEELSDSIATRTSLLPAHSW